MLHTTNFPYEVVEKDSRVLPEKRDVVWRHVAHARDALDHFSYWQMRIFFSRPCFAYVGLGLPMETIFGFQLVTRSRKPSLRNGYVWVMIAQVTLGSTALKQFLRQMSRRWCKILETKIVPSNINDLRKHLQHRDQRGSTSNLWMLHQHRNRHVKQLENLMRQLGSSPKPRELHPTGRERRHHCLLQDVGAILLTRSSSVLFLNAWSCRFLVKRSCRAMRTWSPPANTITLRG